MIIPETFLVRLLGVILALAITFYAYCKWAHQYWKNRGVPYIEPTFPYGNFEGPIKRTRSLGENNANLYNEAKAKGWKYCGIYIFVKPVMIILDLDLIKHVLTKDFHYFVDRGIYVNEKDDPISANLFAIGGSKWKHLRMKLTPTFTSGKMKTMFQTLVSCSSILESYIEEQANNKEGVDIKNVLGHFSTDVIGSCAFGLECNSFKDTNSPFRRYGKKALEVIGNGGLIKEFLMNTLPDLARKLKVTFYGKEMNDFFAKIVHDTVSYREKTNTTRNDFMQLLIDMKKTEEADGENKGDGKALTMDEMVAQSFVFFVAGFETSSTTMTFVLYELARNPEIQDKVRNEIEEVLERHKNQMTYDSINELTYMKQVIDETLRKHSPLPIITRVCVQDYKIPGEDVIIEKGTMIIIPVVGIQSDPQYYENPDIFDPSRFSEENKKNRHQYAHLPFGEGPRVCIGERFGIMQTKVGLATILRKFKVTLNKKTEQPLKLSPYSFIPSAEKGIWLNLEKL